MGTPWWQAGVHTGILQDRDLESCYGAHKNISNWLEGPSKIECKACWV